MLMTARFPEIPSERLSEEQRRIVAEILQGRKSLHGPFNAMLRSPRIADWFQKIGAYLRFVSPLPTKLKELAIIVVARRWSSDIEWHVHSGIAREAGLAESTIATIEDGRRPDLEGDEAAVFDFIVALLTTGFVSDDLFQPVKDRYGEAGATELIAIAGYYCAVSFFLNVDGAALPEGARPLKKIGGGLPSFSRRGSMPTGAIDLSLHSGR
jgi:4-carboxymuconolactone decarboxylase